MSVEYIFDIVNSNQTIKNFKKEYGFDEGSDVTENILQIFEILGKLEKGELACDGYTDALTEKCNLLLKEIKSVEFSVCDFSSSKYSNDINIGDTVKVIYSPDSQKHIEYYDNEDVKGKLFFLDEKTSNGFIWDDQISEDGKCIRHIKSVKRYGCSYYGVSDGYSYYYLKC